ETRDFKYFYPTDMCVTGYDIIFFWVIRMVFSGLYFTGELPFHTVLFNGLVRDELGRKFSKSLGNGIDPLEMTEKYGSDALRFALTSNTVLSGDLKFSEEKVVAARNFNTKIWNACRFVLGRLGPDFKLGHGIPAATKAEDRWILSRYNALVKDVNESLEACDHGTAARRIYDFFWNDYCDWYLEISKFRDDADQVLMFVLEGMLRLMHPFVPFITENIWRQTGRQFLIYAEYPQYDTGLDFTEESRGFDKVIAAVTAVRNLRASMDVKPMVKTTVFIETKDKDIFRNCRYVFDRLASEIVFEAPPSQIKVAAAVTDDARISLPMSELVDKAKEILRLNKEKDKAAAEIQFLNDKLGNPAFKEKAPAALIAAETEKLASAKNRLAMIQQSLADLE
ncbi:MAG: class I tRNA ligase family protein, partial [Alphaproteobacteria bacterium]|nr:class I tRNA ligase family protein [Alphaproteobacteria bacterium]